MISLFFFFFNTSTFQVIVRKVFLLPGSNFPMFAFSTCMFSSYTFNSQFQLEFMLVFSAIHLILFFKKYDYHVVSNYYFKVCFPTDLTCCIYDISPHVVGLFLDFLFCSIGLSCLSL